MTIIFQFNKNRTCPFDENLWMIRKGYITFNWFIKLYKLVFISIHVIDGAIF